MKKRDVYIDPSLLGLRELFGAVKTGASGPPSSLDFSQEIAEAIRDTIDKVLIPWIKRMPSDQEQIAYRLIGMYTSAMPSFLLCSHLFLGIDPKDHRSYLVGALENTLKCTLDILLSIDCDPPRTEMQELASNLLKHRIISMEPKELQDTLSSISDARELLINLSEQKSQTRDKISKLIEDLNQAHKSLKTAMESNPKITKEERKDDN